MAKIRLNFKDKPVGCVCVCLSKRKSTKVETSSFSSSHSLASSDGEETFKIVQRCAWCEMAVPFCWTFIVVDFVGGPDLLRYTKPMSCRAIDSLELLRCSKDFSFGCRAPCCHFVGMLWFVRITVTTNLIELKR